ncbi:MAG: hypothetical protein PVG83_10985 [Acidimicrobiia bacterium]|jgi:hypothetical protein
MLVDTQMVKVQAAYKREQLSKDYKSARREQKTDVKRANEGTWRRFRARRASAF